MFSSAEYPDILFALADALSRVRQDAEEIPRRPVFSVGAREKLKTRGGSLSSEGANAAVQAEKSTPIKVLSSLEYSYALI